MPVITRSSFRFVFSLVAWFALAVLIAPSASAQTKIACIGEATTHSAHRNYDPEYPALMGGYLDADFRVEPTPANPLSGGMLYGAGTNYRVGNFGLPTGVAVDTASTEVAATIRSPQLRTAESFGPQVVILGPYGPHEPYAEVSLPERFAPDLKALATRILAFPSKPTVFIALPIARWGDDTDSVRRNIRNWTVQVAEEMKLPQIDLWTAFLGKRAEFQDQNHLALAGRERMARVISDAVKAWKANGGGIGGAGGMSGSTGGSAGTSSGGSAGRAAAGGASSGGASGASTSSGGVSGASFAGSTSAGGSTNGAAGSSAGTAAAGSTTVAGSPSQPIAQAGVAGASTPPSPGPTPVAGAAAGGALGASAGVTHGPSAPDPDESAGCTVRGSNGGAGAFTWLGALFALSAVAFSARRTRSGRGR